MKIHLETAADRNVIRSYGPGFVMINQQRFTGSLIVLPGQIVTDWRPHRFADFTETDFEAVARLDVEVVLLGTGHRLQFPAPNLTRPIRRAGIGFEVMDTGAACRTYNVLSGEGRRVAAALLPIEL